MQGMATQAAWIGAITIDCEDSESMRRFYREALGGVDMPGHSQSVRVAGMPLNFRELDGWVRPTWPGGDMQIHFELLVPVGELERQAARLVSLGAEKSSHQDPDDPGLIVFLDPAGHPFCLFEDPF
jgi:hypothetical protein